MQKQRIILVNRDFQLRYAGVAVLVGLLSTSLTALLILFPLYMFEIIRIPQFLPGPVLLLMSAAALMNISLVGFMGVILTHRIAGPMYSLVRHFRRIEEGYWYGQMKLRDEDDLRYLVRNYNAMVDSLNRIARQDVEKLSSIYETLQSLDRSGDDRVSKISDEVKQLIQRQKCRLEPGEI